MGIPPDETPHRSDDGDGVGSPHPVSFAVGIGASASDPAALTELLRGLDFDGTCFVIMLCGDAVAEQVSVAVLARQCKLPVITAVDQALLQANVVFVSVPDKHVRVAGGRLQVAQTPLQHEGSVSVDALLRSLASDLGSGAVGVVLEGTRGDGLLGLKEVKAAGGVAFVQQGVEFAGGSLQVEADAFLAPSEIASELMRISQHPFVAGKRHPDAGSSEKLAEVLALLHLSFKVDFSQYKRATVERRIERRMALAQLTSVEAYAQMLRSNTTELIALYRDLLINVTSFFRDQEPFERIKTDVLQRMVDQHRAGGALRIWVPGCASGEEAYSIAINLLEVIGDRPLERPVQIFATDVDDEAISFARLGIYPANIALDVSPERLERFFVRRDGHYQINKQIRDMVIFATHNLTRDPPFSRLGLISCRNVLIYLQPQLQRKVLQIFHYALDPGGAMLLGSSESVGETSTLFTVTDRKVKLFSKRNTPRGVAFDLSADTRALDPAPRHPSEPVARTGRVTVQQLADRKILERYAPAGVLVTHALEVLHFRGRTSAFLEQSAGAPTANLLKLARPELVVPLRTTVTDMFHRGTAVVSDLLRIKDGAGVVSIRIEALPVPDPVTKATCALVLFLPVIEPVTEHPAATSGVQTEQVVAIARELSTTKEYLQSVIAELQSTNEELQASNEELQASKEELQSTNEELGTVNEELQIRMVELAQFKDDLQNILEGLDAPVVIAGMDRRIRFVSRAAALTLGLRPGDVGRPITHLLDKATGARLDTAASGVIDSLHTEELTVDTPDGRTLRLRLTPYRNSQHTIKGVVLSVLSDGRVPRGAP